MAFHVKVIRVLNDKHFTLEKPSYKQIQEVFGLFLIYKNSLIMQFAVSLTS